MNSKRWNGCARPTTIHSMCAKSSCCFRIRKIYIYEIWRDWCFWVMSCYATLDAKIIWFQSHAQRRTTRSNFASIEIKASHSHEMAEMAGHVKLHAVKREGDSRYDSKSPANSIKKFTHSITCNDWWLILFSCGEKKAVKKMTSDRNAKIKMDLKVASKTRSTMNSN